MKSIREWMSEKGIKLESDVQDAIGGVRDDRKELGARGFEGLQDVMDALKVAARINPSSVSSMLDRLSMIVRQNDESLADKVRISGKKFLGVERGLASKEEPQTDDPIAREAP